MPERTLTLDLSGGGRMGIRLSETNEVCAVHEGSPGAAAGLRVGDVVVEVNGEAVEGDNDAVRLLSADKSRKKHTLVVAGASAGGELECVLDLSGGGRMGIRLSETNEVCAVHPDTPGEKSGLRVGDVVVEVNGAAVDGPNHAVRLLSADKSRQRHSRRVSRDGGGDDDDGDDDDAQEAAALTAAAAERLDGAENYWDDPLQAGLDAAAALKDDGNGALASGMPALAAGLYTRAIETLTAAEVASRS